MGGDTDIGVANGTSKIFVKNKEGLSNDSFLNGKTYYSKSSEIQWKIAEIMCLNLPTKTVQQKISQIEQNNWIDTKFYGKNLLDFAVSRGYFDEADKLIGARRNELQEQLNKIACDCIIAGNTSAVKWLIEREYVNVNTTDEHGMPLLFLAIIQKSGAMVDILLEHNADPNKPYKDGNYFMPVLHKAITEKRKDIVEKLVQKGADINAKDRSNYTPLNTALYNSCADIFEYLLFNGAEYSNETNQFDNLSLTRDNYCNCLIRAFKHNKLFDALCAARGEGHQNMVEWIIKQRLHDSELLKALLDEAVTKGLVDKVETYIADAKNQQKWTSWKDDLLFSAVHGKNLDIVRILISERANVNARQNDITPLFIAVLYNSKDIVKELIQAGAKTDVKDRTNHTPLYYAEDDIKEILEQARRNRK